METFVWRESAARSADAMGAGGAEGASVEYTLYTDRAPAARHASAWSHAGLVVRTGAPLLLAITGSAFTPLPCAFSLTGLATGAALLLVIGGANCYTTILMVRAAAALNVSGYEEVLRAAGGARALRWTQLALVVLLFGTLCGALSAVGETGVRALSELASETDSPLAASLASTPAVVGGCAAGILFPLSLASLGESPLTSAIGVAVMASLVSYILYAAIAMPQVHRELGSGSIDDVSPFAIAAALPEAASTFGYAFYIQPVALPLLRALPPGEAGATALADALKLTFALTCAAYLCVGIGGYAYFGRGHVPQASAGASRAARASPRPNGAHDSSGRVHVAQDLLQGFHGRAGGALAGIFCAYLCLCFSPILARDPTLPQSRANLLARPFHSARSQREPLHAGATSGAARPPPPSAWWDTACTVARCNPRRLRRRRGAASRAERSAHRDARGRRGGRGAAAA